MTQDRRFYQAVGILAQSGDPQALARVLAYAQALLDGDTEAAEAIAHDTRGRWVLLQALGPGWQFDHEGRD